MRLFDGIGGMYDRTSSVLVDLLVRLIHIRIGTYTLLVSGQSSVPDVQVSRFNTSSYHPSASFGSMNYPQRLAASFRRAGLPLADKTHPETPRLDTDLRIQV